MKQQANQGASGMLQLRRTTRKVMKGAENAVLQLDRMVGDFVEKHMDS